MNITIKKAISIAGSQQELARRVGVDQSAVSKWLSGGGIKSQYISAIASATENQVSSADILASLPSANQKPTAEQHQA
jgi:DNA-binding transcriptional regulator YdaS (Cro superfamily)